MIIWEDWQFLNYLLAGWKTQFFRVIYGWGRRHSPILNFGGLENPPSFEFLMAKMERGGTV
jgi:hypothetical protein